MTRRWLDHTSEVELELRAGSEAELFAEAAAALGELLGAGHGEPVEREVRVAAHDRGALLVTWLEELVFLAEMEGLVPEGATARVGPGSVEGIVRGRCAVPRPLVKAVTYHRLEVGQDDAGWHARVVLDV